MSNRKISSIQILTFRGIPNKCELSFSEKGEPRSVILYGGNGSGKSSIIDAIEFALQARIGRSVSIKNPLRPSALSLRFKGLVPPVVAVTFDDLSTFERTILIEEKADEETGLKEYSFSSAPEDMCEDFDRVPVVLRRHDLIDFNNTKEQERQLLISQFIYHDNSSSKLNNDPVILELEGKLLKLKKKKQSLFKQLCEILEVDPYYAEKDSNGGILDYCNSLIAQNPKMAVSKSGKRRRLVPYETYAKAKTLSIGCDKIRAEIKDIQTEINKQKSILSHGENNPITLRIKKVLEESSKYLTPSFKELSNVDYIKDIRLSVGSKTQVSFNIEVVLNNDKVVSPTDVFSEANYDLMILLLYLSIIRVGVDMGQSPVLVLEDVLQSVDATIRTRFIDYVLRELANWQLIITCHDRLWLEQLKYMFYLRRHRFKEFQIHSWSFENGPFIKEAKSHITNNTLKDALATENVRIISAVSGPFLEMICNELSISLKCPVRRTPLDRYTLGDLWPVVKKVIGNTNLRDIVNEIDRLLYIRNLLGCHYNQWADELSDEEIYRFANAIQSLYENTYCPVCLSWIQSTNSWDKDISCNCGNLDYSS